MDSPLIFYNFWMALWQVFDRLENNTGNVMVPNGGYTWSACFLRLHNMHQKKWELDTEVAVLRALDELDAKRQIINELDSCRLASVPTTYIQDLLPRALVDELLKFVRTSPLGEFRLRLKLRLEAPTCFPWNDGKDHPNLSVLLMANMKRKHPLGGSQQFDGNCDFNPAPPRFWMIWRKAFKCFMQPQGFT